MPHLLLVDDDPSLREVARYALARAGHEVTEASDGKEAVEKATTGSFDLIVLDVSMPELDGFEVCQTLRRDGVETPIVFLSSRAEELDRVLGLELGGDDYLTKPFSPRELVSRVKAVLRRARPAPAPSPSSTIEAAGVRLDLEAFRIWAAADPPALAESPTEVKLTVTEFRILSVLVKRPGRVYPRDELTELAYPGVHHVSDRTLDSHIRRIRQKLREAGCDPIETVHGLGFRLRDER